MERAVSAVAWLCASSLLFFGLDSRLWVVGGRGVSVCSAVVVVIVVLEQKEREREFWVFFFFFFGVDSRLWVAGGGGVKCVCSGGGGGDCGS